MAHLFQIVTIPYNPSPDRDGNKDNPNPGGDGNKNSPGPGGDGSND